jgi:hypothetical protein
MSATGPNLVRAFVAARTLFPPFDFANANQGSDNLPPKFDDFFLSSIDHPLALSVRVAIVDWVGQFR